MEPEVLNDAKEGTQGAGEAPSAPEVEQQQKAPEALGAGDEVAKEQEGLEEEETPEEAVPFHNHPRWKAMEEERRYLRATVDELKAEKEERIRLESMTPEERKANEEAKRLGLATKFDVDSAKGEAVRLRREIAFKDFLLATPAAAGDKEMVYDLALLPSNHGKSFAEIWSTYQGSRKVINKTVRTSIRPKAPSEQTKGGAQKFTADEIKAMDNKTYEANRDAILASMR